MTAANLDLSPAPGAAPAAQRVFSHARAEAVLVIRNGEQWLLALVIPIGILVAGRLAGDRVGWNLDEVAPSVLGLALWSTTFTSVAITTGFERRYGVLERLASTPLGRSGLLLGKTLAVTGLAVVQMAILIMVGLALGWRPHPNVAGTVVALLAVALAGVAFVGAALSLAGALRAEATLAWSNLIYLGGAMTGLLVPASVWPGVLGVLIRLTPTGALGGALRTWSSGGAEWLALPVLALWAALGTAVARRTFRWLS